MILSLRLSLRLSLSLSLSNQRLQDIPMIKTMYVLRKNIELCTFFQSGLIAIRSYV